jgi:hypothetical protein
MSPILRHFPQDKVVPPQKSTINWGFFHDRSASGARIHQLVGRKAGKMGLFWPSLRAQNKRAAAEIRRGPSHKA